MKKYLCMIEGVGYSIRYTGDGETLEEAFKDLSEMMERDSEEPPNVERCIFILSPPELKVTTTLTIVEALPTKRKV